MPARTPWRRHCGQAANFRARLAAPEAAIQFVVVGEKGSSSHVVVGELELFSSGRRVNHYIKYS